MLRNSSDQEPKQKLPVGDMLPLSQSAPRLSSDDWHTEVAVWPQESEPQADQSTPAMNLLATSMANWKSQQSNPGGETTASPVSPTSAHSNFDTADDGTKKQLLTQFTRLDKGKRGKLESNDICAVLDAFVDNWELEDLDALLRYLQGISGAETDDQQRDLSKRRSGSELTISNTAKAQGKEILTLAAFIMLMTSERVFKLPTPHSISRDAEKLKTAFLAENNNALYADDGHMKGDGGFRLPTGKEALFFDFVPAIVILINAAVIGFSTDHANLSGVWQGFEYFFLVFYSGEIFAKLFLFGPRWFWTGPDRIWNIFDAVCLVLSLGDAVISTMLLMDSSMEAPVDLTTLMLIKMMRMSRLFRLVRTLRYEIFNELKVMVLGVISGMRCLLWAMVLLIAIIYIFGVLTCNLIGNEYPEFEDVTASMFTLFRCFTEGCMAYDGSPLTEKIRAKHGFLFLGPYFLVWMGTSLGVFNLVMAVFIDNVMVGQLIRKLNEISNSANRVEVEIKEQLLRIILQSSANGVPEAVEQEIVQLKATLSNRAARIRAQFSVLENSNVVISRPAFNALLQDRKFVRVLSEASIETANSAAIFDILDADMSGWLSVHEVYIGLMRLRGPISKSEIVGLRLRLRHVTQMLHGVTE